MSGSLRSGDMLEKQVSACFAIPKRMPWSRISPASGCSFAICGPLNPDRGRFPNFDDKLREAMVRETELFFGAVMRGDSSILDFIDSDFTYVNERLARHYGIPGIKGEQFRRVKLKGHERGGLLTQASILTVTSNPTRTSPVKRGKWVLEQLLGTPPPPPPPNVPVLTEDAKALTAATLRLRMEQHRSKVSCAVCHNKLDPLGFGLENFDAIGAWRDQDGGVTVDSSGKLPSGESFRGPGELKAILKAHRSEFTRCLTEKMLTYALGRGLEEYDHCAVEQIVRGLESSRYRFTALVLGIVKSDPFQKRRGSMIESMAVGATHDEAIGQTFAADGLAWHRDCGRATAGSRRWCLRLESGRMGQARARANRFRSEWRFCTFPTVCTWRTGRPA